MGEHTRALESANRALSAELRRLRRINAALRRELIASRAEVMRLSLAPALDDAPDADDGPEWAAEAARIESATEEGEAWSAGR